MTRRLPLVLLALAALLLAACGEARSRPAAPAQQPLRLDARLLPQRRPRRDLRGPGQRRLQPRRASTSRSRRRPIPPRRSSCWPPARSTSPISYEPELLLARDKGLKLVAVGALVQKPLTSIMSIGKHAIADPAQLKGKTVGTAGIPYQSAYLKTILAARRRRPVVGQGGQRRLQPRAGDAVEEGRRDARRVLELRGRPAAPAEGQHPKIIRMENVGVPTYDELVIVARQQDLAKGGERVRRFMRALGQGHAAAALRPRGRRRAAAGGQPRPRPRPAARERQGDAARLLPGRRQAVRLDGPAPSGRATATGCTPTSCSAARPTPPAR